MIQGRRVTRGSSWLALSHWDRWGREGRTLTTGSFFSYFISVVVAFTFTLHSGVLFPNSKQDERRRRQRSASFPDGRRASHSPPNDFFVFVSYSERFSGPLVADVNTNQQTLKPPCRSCGFIAFPRSAMCWVEAAIEKGRNTYQFSDSNTCTAVNEQCT